MVKDLDAVLSEFATTGTDATKAFDVLKKIGRAIGFDHAVATYRCRAGAKFDTFQASTYSQAWTSEAMQLSSAEILRDPIVKHLTTRVDPVFWGRRDYDLGGLSSLYERFQGYGLGSGMALSVRGANDETLSVGFSNSEQRDNAHSMPIEQIGAMYLSATAMFSRLASLNAKSAKDKPAKGASAPRLTPREIECLQWARVGKTSWEMSQILGVSQATAIFHMKNAISKLEASNKTHAVMVAVEQGLIQ